MGIYRAKMQPQDSLFCVDLCIKIISCKLHSPHYVIYSSMLEQRGDEFPACFGTLCFYKFILLEITVSLDIKWCCSVRCTLCGLVPVWTLYIFSIAACLVGDIPSFCVCSSVNIWHSSSV